MEANESKKRYVLFQIESVPINIIQDAIEKGKPIPNKFKIALSYDDDENAEARIFRVGECVIVREDIARVLIKSGVGYIIKEVENYGLGEFRQVDMAKVEGK